MAIDKALSAAEDPEVLQTLVTHLREVLFIRDPIAQRMLFVNPVFEEIWGIPRQALYDNPRAFLHAVLEEDRPGVLAAVRAQDEHGIPFALEYRIRVANGQVRWIFARTFFVRRGNTVDRVVGLAEDITERKEAEARLLALQQDLARQVEERTAELRASLAEKELLLREVHHRVKNNLQLVSSLLYLQSERTTDPIAQAALRDSRERIRAIALAHAQLHQSSSLARIQLAEYANTVVASFVSVFENPNVSVRVLRENSGVEVPLDRAIPIGLILNELLTNALRHAFPDGRAGEVAVTVAKECDGRVRLSVRDDGIGMPGVVDVERAMSFGLRIVRMLVSQLEGTLEAKTAPGTTFVVRFAA